MPGKPIGNLFGLVGEGVVQGGVNYLLRELRWRVVEEGYELLPAVFPVVLSDRGAVQDVARGTRARAAAALAVVGARFPLAGLHRQRVPDPARHLGPGPPVDGHIPAFSGGLT